MLRLEEKKIVDLELDRMSKIFIKQLVENELVELQNFLFQHESMLVNESTGEILNENTVAIVRGFLDSLSYDNDNIWVLESDPDFWNEK